MSTTARSPQHGHGLGVSPVVSFHARARRRRAPPPAAADFLFANLVGGGAGAELEWSAAAAAAPERSELRGRCRRLRDRRSMVMGRDDHVASSHARARRRRAAGRNSAARAAELLFDLIDGGAAGRRRQFLFVDRFRGSRGRRVSNGVAVDHTPIAPAMPWPSDVLALWIYAWPLCCMVRLQDDRQVGDAHNAKVAVVAAGLLDCVGRRNREHRSCKCLAADAKGIGGARAGRASAPAAHRITREVRRSGT